MEHDTGSFVDGFGTLLGPEKTPAVGGVFLVRPFLALGRLTHPCVGVVVVVGGWGVVVC